MNKEIKNETLGQYLKEERNQRGVSIEEIAGDTKINIKILENLENDSLSELPAPAFVKGFIKSYCKYLGIDSQKPLMLFDILQLGDKVDTKIDKFVDKDLVKIKKVNRNFVWWSFAIVIFLFILGVLLYFFNKSNEINVETEKVTIKQNSMKDLDQKLDNNGSEAILDSENNNKTKQLKNNLKKSNKKTKLIESNSISNLAKLESDNALKLDEKKDFKNNKDSFNNDRIRNNENRQKEQKVEEKNKENIEIQKISIFAKKLVWIKVKIDDQKATDYMLSAGKTKVIRAEDEIKLVIGDASAVKIVYNNKVLDNLGREKLVRSIVFPGLKRWR